MIFDQGRREGGISYAWSQSSRAWVFASLSKRSTVLTPNGDTYVVWMFIGEGSEYWRKNTTQGLWVRGLEGALILPSKAIYLG